MSEKTLSAAEMGAKGGKARAESLTPEQLSEIGRKAAQARWNQGDVVADTVEAPRATHAGEMRIGDISIPCFVLENGTRVISHRGLQQSLGRTMSGGAQNTARFLGQFERKVDDGKNLTARVSNPLLFIPPTYGRSAYGYEATVLVDICEVILAARQAGKATGKHAERVAERCEILVRGFARVGIIALIDEATGFQYERPRRDLEEYLKKFLSDSLRRWVRTFPADYFKHLCRLRNVELRPDMRLPLYFGHLTNDLVYRRLAPGLLHRLKEWRVERGSPNDKLHSWLSADVGFPEVLLHLGTVVGLMKLHTDYDAFQRQLDQIAPVYPKEPGLFDDPKDWEK
jgi:hypothetical protein